MQSDAFVATERHSGTVGGVDPTGEEAADGMAQLVIGSPGKDTLTGGDLDDTLVAARGRMTMTGNEGADTFVIGQGRINATITDFTLGVDKLQFENAGKLGTGTFMSGRITATRSSRSGTTRWCCKGSNLHQSHPHDLNNLLV